jgi:dual specificity MAP kinase phosphatase
METELMYLSPSPSLSILSDNDGSHTPNKIIHEINHDEFMAMIQRYHQTPLPASDVVFPWLHGIRESNVTQRIYFSEKRREHSRKYYSSNAEKQPKISFTKDDLIDVPKPPDLNGLVIVKVYEEEPCMVDCDFTLRNSISPHEILEHKPQDNHGTTKPYTRKRNPSLSLDPNDFLPQFKDVDPRSSYSIRNLHIQIAKWATLSDVVLYSIGTPKGTSKLLQFASLISNAQKAHYRRCLANPGLSAAKPVNYNLAKKTFVLNVTSDCIRQFFANQPQLFTTPPSKKPHELPDQLDLLAVEDACIETVSAARIVGESGNESLPVKPPKTESPNEISPRAATGVVKFGNSGDAIDKAAYRCLIDCRNVAVGPFTISKIDQLIRGIQRDEDAQDQIKIFFALNSWDPFIFINLCKFMYLHGQRGRGDTLVFSSRLPCEDAVLLPLVYIMYSKGLSVKDAILDYMKSCQRPVPNILHRHKVLLTELDHLMPTYSPVIPGNEHRRHHGVDYDLDYKYGELKAEGEPWLFSKSGFPSPIFDDVYLGSVDHANNFALLRHMGIKRVLSIGYKIDSKNPEIDEHLEIEDILDDGADSISPHLDKCVEFLHKGNATGEKTLVHCQVGSSRSAIVCMAYAMVKMLNSGGSKNISAATKASVVNAYMHVRVRRADVVVQPNLRLLYELFNFGESKGVEREIDWPILCHQIYLLNCRL